MTPDSHGRDARLSLARPAALSTCRIIIRANGAPLLLDLIKPPAVTSLRLAVPTLVIWRFSDLTMLSGLLDGLEEYVQDLTVVRINDAGHYPMRSHPDPVNLAIRTFVRRLR